MIFGIYTFGILDLILKIPYLKKYGIFLKDKEIKKRNTVDYFCFLFELNSF